MPLSDLQRDYLDAMGIAVWRQRTPADAPAVAQAPQDAPPEADEAPAATASRSAALEARPADPVPPAATVDATPARFDVSGAGWAELEAKVSACTACRLCEGRTKTVFGRGDRSADWMIVGEGPGAEEDRQGLPFVGRAGQLLDRMVKAAGFDREAVYVANVVKCRPPGNRDPKPDEAAACRAYLERQIALVQPKLILAVGRVAAQHLLDSTEPLGRLRGCLHTLGSSPGVPVAVTYHPAYFLRSPSAKGKTWDDLKMALDATEAGSS